MSEDCRRSAQVEWDVMYHFENTHKRLLDFFFFFKYSSVCHPSLHYNSAFVFLKFIPSVVNGGCLARCRQKGCFYMPTGVFGRQCHIMAFLSLPRFFFGCVYWCSFLRASGIPKWCWTSDTKKTWCLCWLRPARTSESGAKWESSLCPETLK